MAGVGGGSCHWGRLWRGLSMRPRPFCLPCVHAQCPECPGWWQGGWEGTGGPVCLSRQGAWLGRCPGVGQGLGASAMPLFLHKGPLTCTSPERGTLQGPSLRMGTGNLQSKAPCRAGAVLQPSQAWRHLASRDGGGLGFACAVGTAQRSLCPRARQGHSRPLHTWVSMALLGDTCH